MNKRGFTLIELLVSITLVSLIAYFLFQIIFIIRDIYVEKNIKSELYIETSNVTNIINKDITSKLNDGINLLNARKVTDSKLDIIYSDGSLMEINVDKEQNKITYGTYSVDISPSATIGSIGLYYNYDLNELDKNGVFYIKIPITLEKYNKDFSIYIYSRYDSSYAIIGGELLTSSNNCPYGNGFTWTFDYTGDSQEFITPCKGIYKVELWGASGGNASSASGGKGGYASGYTQLDDGTAIYVVVGGAGASSSLQNSTNIAGGYNGGGNGRGSADDICGAGGGATHMAKVTGTLADIGYDSFITQGNGIIVAGAGGGAGLHKSGVSNPGGYGGGLIGGNGSGSPTGYPNGAFGKGGTQTEGGVALDGLANSGTFGAGGSYQPQFTASGGGAGLFGGGAGRSTTSSGGGGSSYIGGVTDGVTIAGNASMPKHDGTSGTMNGNSGNGYAKITLISSNTTMHTVTFNLDGGTSAEETREVISTTEIGELPIPTKDNHTFEGWYLEPGFSTKIDSTYVVNDDVTLYAKYISTTLNLYNAGSISSFVGNFTTVTGTGDSGCTTCSLTVTYASNYVRLNSGQGSSNNCGTAIISNNKIDFSNYTKLCVNASYSSSGVTMSYKGTTQYGFSTSTRSARINGITGFGDLVASKDMSSGTSCIDISNYNDSYHVIVNNYYNGYTDVYRIWLSND